MHTDNQLIHKIKKKQSRQAADEIISRYYKEIYTYTYRQVVDTELAKDLTQDIFITMLKGIVTFDEKKAKFRTWLYRVASNKIMDYYRSYYHKSRILEDTDIFDLDEILVESDDYVLEKIFHKEKIHKIMEIVTQYDVAWISIFQKKCFEEKTFMEIAQEMGISENTVKSRFYKMLKKVKDEVTDYE